MAAVVNWQRHTGAATGSPAQGTTKTTIAEAGTTRFSLSDSPSPGSANPVVVPSAGTNRSWWMSEALATGNPAAAGGITNVLLWWEATWASGITEDGGFVNGYVQAANANQLNDTNYSGLKQKDGSTAGASTDITNQTSGWRAAAKATWPITAAGDTTTINTTFTWRFASQLAVASTFAGGPGVQSLTGKASYDET